MAAYSATTIYCTYGLTNKNIGLTNNLWSNRYYHIINITIIAQYFGQFLKIYYRLNCKSLIFKNIFYTAAKNKSFQNQQLTKIVRSVDYAG